MTTGNLLTYAFGIVAVVAVFAQLSEPKSALRKFCVATLVLIAIVTTLLIFGNAAETGHDDPATKTPTPAVVRVPQTRVEPPPASPPGSDEQYIDTDVWLESIDFPDKEASWWVRTFGSRLRIEGIPGACGGVVGRCC